MLRVVCIGRVVNDPKTNDPAASGKKKCTNFSLVTSKYAGTNPDKTPKYESVFLNCVGFDWMADALAKISKGDTLYVNGEVEISMYEKDGKPSASLKCYVREWEKVYTGSKPSETSTAKADDDGDDDVAGASDDTGDDIFG